MLNYNDQINLSLAETNQKISYGESLLGKHHTCLVNMTELPQYRPTDKEEILDLCLSLSHGFSSCMKTMANVIVLGECCILRGRYYVFFAAGCFLIS